VGTVSINRQPAAGHGTGGSAGLLVTMVRRLEHEVLVGVDHATDFLLSPFSIDFRGWTFGDQRNETWM
jgi:hypothetical protein